MVLNTSLNVNGKPIAGYKQDAVKLFNTSEMDAVVIGDEILVK
jgi:predicted NodU family carbamoyl transferase